MLLPPSLADLQGLVYAREQLRTDTRSNMLMHFAHRIQRDHYRIVSWLPFMSISSVTAGHEQPPAKIPANISMLEKSAAAFFNIRREEVYYDTSAITVPLHPNQEARVVLLRVCLLGTLVRYIGMTEPMHSCGSTQGWRDSTATFPEIHPTSVTRVGRPSVACTPWRHAL